MQLIKPEDISAVSRIKRVLEYSSFFPEYNEMMEKDPQRLLDELDLGLTIEDISLRNRFEGNKKSMYATFPESKGQKYADFINSKIEYRDEILRTCEPVEPAFKKWRKRQMGRCTGELGAKNTSLVHVPFSLEMADGCSVGCAFCGLNAGRLKSIFRYTPENAILFNDVIRISKNIIGEAAGRGTMYFASEPLDNPDYELFLKDYRRVFKYTPQITTAVSTRDIERTRRLVSELKPDSEAIYRFSITSREMAETIFASFTPEELVFVELLPQFEEAPGNAFANVGREGDKNDEYGDTISCMTGFRVNMARQDITLTTPTFANREHPTGEYILDRVTFTDADDYEAKLKMLIKKHMMNIISPKDEVKMRDFLKIRDEEQDYIVEANYGAEYHFRKTENTAVYGALLQILKDGYKTKRAVYDALTAIPEYENTSPETIFFIINRLWEMGIIELKSGNI